MHMIMIQQSVLYSMVVGRRTYAVCNIYIPRAPISIYTWGRGTPGLDVKTDRKRSLPIEHVYTYIPPKMGFVSVKSISYISPRYAKKRSEKNLPGRQ